MADAANGNEFTFTFKITAGEITDLLTIIGESDEFLLRGTLHGYSLTSDLVDLRNRLRQARAKLMIENMDALTVMLVGGVGTEDSRVARLKRLLSAERKLTEIRKIVGVEP